MTAIITPHLGGLILVWPQGEGHLVWLRQAKEPEKVEIQSAIHPSKGWLVIQAVIGSIAGVVSDYCAYFCVRDILIRSHVISLTDAFEGDYSHPGLQRALACFVFVALFLCLLGLRRWSRVTYFATAALISHVSVGGLVSLALLFFIDY